MHAFRKRLRETVTECREQDAVVVVVVALEQLRSVALAETCGHREGADVVVDAGADGCDEVRQGEVRP